MNRFLFFLNAFVLLALSFSAQGGTNTKPVSGQELKDMADRYFQSGFYSEARIGYEE